MVAVQLSPLYAAAGPPVGVPNSQMPSSDHQSPSPASKSSKKMVSPFIDDEAEITFVRPPPAGGSIKISRDPPEAAAMPNNTPTHTTDVSPLILFIVLPSIETTAFGYGFPALTPKASRWREPHFIHQIAASCLRVSAPELFDGHTRHLTCRTADIKPGAESVEPERRREFACALPFLGHVRGSNRRPPESRSLRQPCGRSQHSYHAWGYADILTRCRISARFDTFRYNFPISPI